MCKTCFLKCPPCDDNVSDCSLVCGLCQSCTVIKPSPRSMRQEDGQIVKQRLICEARTGSTLFSCAGVTMTGMVTHRLLKEDGVLGEQQSKVPKRLGSADESLTLCAHCRRQGTVFQFRRMHIYALRVTRFLRHRCASMVNEKLKIGEQIETVKLVGKKSLIGKFGWPESADAGNARYA